jgi:hypothetical protein
MYDWGTLETNMNYAYNLECLGVYSSHTDCTIKLMCMGVDWHQHKSTPSPHAFFILPMDVNITNKVLPSSVFNDIVTISFEEDGQNGDKIVCITFLLLTQYTENSHHLQEATFPLFSLK